ncbi:hypothetical protein DL764_010268 [Monosporascus ibericus]|uniref:Uncharacterized protein n=1 Tax=Monosporascus ibericus TaxID=155417 RepID=A0A4Q4SSZ4_9PEZI|nr:hypothetical protein DL764_010268 [Monosporascus ibericus]
MSVVLQQTNVVGSWSIVEIKVVPTSHRFSLWLPESGVTVQELYVGFGTIRHQPLDKVEESSKQTHLNTVTHLYWGELERIEEQLAQDNQHIQLRAIVNGELFSQPNPNRSLGTADPLPGDKRTQPLVRFNDERKLRQAILSGQQNQFSCVEGWRGALWGPGKSEADTRQEMRRIVDEREASEEYPGPVNALKSSTLSPRMGKVVGFGMGFIASNSAGPAKAHRKEHAMALTIAKTIEEIGGESVAVSSQEPQFTSRLQEGTGRRVRDPSHRGVRCPWLHPRGRLYLRPRYNSSICVRETIADLARPAGMCWRPSATPAQIRTMDDLRWDVRADIDTTRTENMMRGYPRVPGARAS